MGLSDVTVYSESVYSEGVNFPYIASLRVCSPPLVMMPKDSIERSLSAIKLLVCVAGDLLISTSLLVNAPAAHDAFRVSFSLSLYSLCAGLLSGLLVMKNRMFVVYRYLYFTAGWTLIVAMGCAGVGAVCALKVVGTGSAAVQMSVPFAMLVALFATVMLSETKMKAAITRTGYNVDS